MRSLSRPLSTAGFVAITALDPGCVPENYAGKLEYDNEANVSTLIFNNPDVVVDEIDGETWEAAGSDFDPAESLLVTIEKEDGSTLELQIKNVRFGIDESLNPDAEPYQESRLSKNMMVSVEWWCGIVDLANTIEQARAGREDYIPFRDTVWCLPNQESDDTGFIVAN